MSYPSIEEVVLYSKTLVGGGVDYDGWYGMQCVDLIEHLDSKFWNDHALSGNAIDYMSNRLPAGHKRFKKGEAQIQIGDYAIWHWGSNDIYGHIGYVTAVDGNNITSVEQNVDGAPVGVGGPARIRTRNDYYLVAFIRPSYSDNPEAAQRVANHNWTRIPETGTFTSTIDDNIYIRRGAPSKSAPYAKTNSGETVWYTKGQSVNYDSYVISEGYIWISYIGAESGERNFIATGEWNGHQRTSTWGTFK